MALTVMQARDAGKIAAEIDGLGAAIAEITAALAAGASINQLSAGTSMGILSSPVPMSVSDSATILNAALQIYQGMSNALVNELSQIGA